MVKRWTSDEILGMVRAFQPACVLVAAAELDIFTTLSQKPMTAQSVADELYCDQRATTILLDALTALGFLTKRQNKYSVLPETAEILSETRNHNMLPAMRHLGNCLRRWAQLAKVTQTGKPVERSPSIRGADADVAAFIGAMDNFCAPIAAQIIDKCRKASHSGLQPLTFRHLLDIGGACGTWAIAFLHSVPQAKATLFDLPEVIPMARRHIADAGFTDRIKLVAGDHYKDKLPSGSDFAWLSAVAHQNSREQNQALFAKIYAALPKTGVLVIRDVVMDECRSQSEAGALFAVNMLVSTEGGGTYTFNEFRDDLLQAGFQKVTLIYKDKSMNSLIRADKLIADK